MENLSWDDVVGGTVWSGYGWDVIPPDKVERIDHRGNERVITIARIIEVKPGMGAQPGTEEIRFPGEGNIRFA
jgi:hypothetical protein